MSIEISKETEARLTAEAKRLGISVDTLLARLVGKPAEPAPTQPRPELPAWDLGAGELHRRDIYDDVG
jgi:transposase